MKASYQPPGPPAWQILLLAAVLLLAPGAAARAGAPLEARLTFAKSTFNLDDPADPIGAVLTLTNTSGEPVLTQAGFGQLGYHLYLYFSGPEPYGTLITSAGADGNSAPTPTVPPPTVAAEWLPHDWRRNMPIERVRDYYPLNLPGKYRVWFKMAFVQYDPNKAEAIDTEPDGIIDGYRVPYNAVIWSEPLASDPPAYITLTTAISEIRSDIRVRATEYVYDKDGEGDLVKQPLDIQVRLYRTADIEASGLVSNPVNQKDFGDIATNPSIRGYLLAAQAPTPGEYIYREVPKDDYVVIGYADRVTDYKHLGALVESDNEKWGSGEIFVNLKLKTGKDKNEK